MKTLTLICFIVMSGLTSTKNLAAPGSSLLNNTDISDRHLTGFNAIDAGGSFDVYIKQGATESVRVEAPASVMQHIITEVRGGILKLYDKNNGWRWSGMFGSHRHIAVYVTARSLNAISATGSGDVHFKDGITSNSLRLDLSGSGDMSGKLNVRTLSSTLSGSGDLHISGKANSADVDMSGSGDYHGRDVAVATAAVRLSGSGDAYLNVSTRLDASTSGSGDVHYTGAVRNVSASKSGSGDIERN